MIVPALNLRVPTILPVLSMSSVPGLILVTLPPPVMPFVESAMVEAACEQSKVSGLPPVSIPPVSVSFGIVRIVPPPTPPITNGRFVVLSVAPCNPNVAAVALPIVTVEFMLPVPKELLAPEFSISVTVIVPLLMTVAPV